MVAQHVWVWLQLLNRFSCAAREGKRREVKSDDDDNWMRKISITSVRRLLGRLWVIPPRLPNLLFLFFFFFFFFFFFNDDDGFRIIPIRRTRTKIPIKTSGERERRGTTTATRSQCLASDVMLPEKSRCSGLFSSSSSKKKCPSFFFFYYSVFLSFFLLWRRLFLFIEFQRLAAHTRQAIFIFKSPFLFFLIIRSFSLRARSNTIGATLSRDEKDTAHRRVS